MIQLHRHKLIVRLAIVNYHKQIAICLKISIVKIYVCSIATVFEFFVNRTLPEQKSSRSKPVHHYFVGVRGIFHVDQCALDTQTNQGPMQNKLFV